MATCFVYRRAAAKRRVTITADLEKRVLEGLATTSQQVVARQLGLSQSAVSKIVRRHRAEATQ